MLKFFELPESTRGGARSKMNGLAFSIWYTEKKEGEKSYGITLSQDLSVEVVDLKLQFAASEYTDDLFFVFGTDGHKLSPTGKEKYNLATTNKGVVLFIADVLKLDMTKPVRMVYQVERQKNNAYKIINQAKN